MFHSAFQVKVVRFFWKNGNGDFERLLGRIVFNCVIDTKCGYTWLPYAFRELRFYKLEEGQYLILGARKVRSQ